MTREKIVHIASGVLTISVVFGLAAASVAGGAGAWIALVRYVARSCSLLAVALLVATTPALADTCCTEPVTATEATSGDLHLLIVKSDGTLQLWRGLSDYECEFMKARSLGLPATDEEKAEAKRQAVEYAAKIALITKKGEEACVGKKNGTVDINPQYSTYCVDGKSAGWGSNILTISSQVSVRSAECFR
jgi:hypothetical protein